MKRVNRRLAALFGDLEHEKRYLERREADGQTVVRSGPKDTVVDLLQAVNKQHKGLVMVPREEELREAVEDFGHTYNTRTLISHVEKALRRVAAHLGAALHDTSMWQRGARWRVFISYETKSGLNYARGLQRACRRIKVDAFVADKSIQPSKKWARQIESALATCDACVPILTKPFALSEWTNQEVGYCLQRRVPIISVEHGGKRPGFSDFIQALPRSMDEPAAVARTISRILSTSDAGTWSFPRRGGRDMARGVGGRRRGVGRRQD